MLLELKFKSKEHVMKTVIAHDGHKPQMKGEGMMSNEHDANNDGA